MKILLTPALFSRVMESSLLANCKNWFWPELLIGNRNQMDANDDGGMSKLVGLIFGWRRDEWGLQRWTYDGFLILFVLTLGWPGWHDGWPEWHERWHLPRRRI